MSLARSLRLASLLPLVLLVTPLPAAAQFSSALQGTISDTQQAFVPDATVRVTNTTTGVTREVATSADGVYRVPSLGAGVYTVEIEKTGFLKARRENLRLGISETLRLDFTLEVSGVAESVTVESKAPLVETEQGRVSGRVDRTLLQEMPLSGRNLYNLLALQPGVTGRGFSASISGGGGADDSFAGESAPRINASGQRDEANNFTVDDTSTNGVARGGITNLTPNTESVEEVRVVSNNFSAVDGRNPGAQIQVITKARHQPVPRQRLLLLHRQPALGEERVRDLGPGIQQEPVRLQPGRADRANRLFFFTSYEGLRQTGARGSTFTVETPEFRDFIQQTRPNSIAAQLLRDFAPAVNPTSNFRDLGSPAPGANVIGPADGILDVGSAFFVPEGWRDGDQFSARVDYELKPGKDRLYGNFYRTRSYAVTGGIRPAFNRPTPNWTTFGNVNYTHTFNATKLNEFRGGVMRLVGLPDTPEHLEIPGHHHHRRHGIRTVGISERLVADQLALQGHLHVGHVGAHAEDGRRAAADVRLGNQHQQLHSRLLVLEPPQLRRRRGAADDPLRRSANRRAGDRVLGADADRVGVLHQRRLEGDAATSPSTPACATRTTARSRTATTGSGT